MMNKIGFCFIFLLLVQQSVAQYYNNWYFGDHAGISFQPGALPLPHILTGSIMTTNEGCSTISDENGNLLFYTNGLAVFNRKHQLMLNGNELNGHFSAVQTAVIVPMPGNDSLYYIFTADAYEDDFKKGYCYSIVNMKKDGGLGAVVLKNILLHAYNSERLTAARHANGVDIWIVTNDKDSNIFRSWLLTCHGLEPAPVVSAAGEVLNQTLFMNIGTIKISPDGSRLCQTFYAGPEIKSRDSSFFQVFDFNNSTGQISNARKISFAPANVFGCEFSPDSRLLYLSSPFTASIEQVEATLSTGTAIEASRLSINTEPLIFYLQLAPDKKIYCTTESPFLSVIAAPDNKGTACNFQKDKIDLGNKNGKSGLPFVLHEPDPDPNGFSFQLVDSCSGTIQFHGFTSLAQASWEWDFGDGTKASGQNVSHQFIPAGAGYLVKLKIFDPALCGYILRTHWVLPLGQLLKAGFDFQADCNSNQVSFTNNSQYTDTAGVHFNWSFGDGSGSTEVSPLHQYNMKGIYKITLEIEGSAACAKDTFSIMLDLNYPVISAGPDQVINEGQYTQLHASSTLYPIHWLPAPGLSDTLDFNPLVMPDETITYYVTASSNAGCKSMDSVLITVKALTDILMPSAFTPNGDGLNDLLKPLVGRQFNLLDFSVFNRWGQCVYYTKEKGKGWDGTWNGQEQYPDVYIWQVRTITKQGRSFSAKGTVVLIR